jgi:hypothetical protein
VKTAQAQKKGRSQWTLPFLAVPVAAAAMLAGGRSACAKDSVTAAVRQPSILAIRAIDDPGTRTEWLLLPDSRHPGGPGQMLRVPMGKGGGRERGIARPVVANGKTVVPPAIPVIFGGDRVVVEDNAGHVEARFEGTAMEPAILGGCFQVRLRFSGRVVRATSLGPGRAKLAPGIEMRP